MSNVWRGIYDEAQNIPPAKRSQIDNEYQLVRTIEGELIPQLGLMVARVRDFEVCFGLELVDDWGKWILSDTNIP